MTLVLDSPKHPKNKKLSDAIKEDAEIIKTRKGLIDKHATLVKAPDDESDANADLGGTMRPTDEQVLRINQFSRKAVTADEVVVFDTLSCNDIVDRDDDQFTTECVKDFAALKEPFSSVGKGYMLDHNYSVGNAVGRIFGVDTKKVSGALFLTNEVYIPKTEKNASFIEDIDYGINWAVSVGVMLGKDECSVCKSPFSSWGYWCTEGHDKGFFYDPKSDETDTWGYPVPCDPKTKGAVKCVRKFSEPRDFYELSQVFLGAQYFAALEKLPDFASVMKSVSDAAIPTIGLSTKEAEDLPFRHEPKRVSDARRLYGVTETKDGSLVWTDEHNLRFSYNPDEPDEGISSLGKAAITNKEESDAGSDQVPGSEGSEGEGELNGGVSDEQEGGGLGSGEDQGSEDGNLEGSESGAPGPVKAAASEEEENDDSDSSPEDDEDDEDKAEDDEEDSDEDESNSDTAEDKEEEKAVTKKSVLEAASKAKLPTAVIDAAKEAPGNGLDVLLRGASSEIVKLRKEKKALEPKAVLGDDYLKAVRSEAIDWYVKARQDDGTQSVKIETFERLLEKCGDDVELIRAMAQEQKEAAQAKFPKSVRRSSFPSDPNVPGGLSSDADQQKHSSDEGNVAENDRRVRRHHG